jgi:hypothetical protein
MEEWRGSRDEWPYPEPKTLEQTKANGLWLRGQRNRETAEERAGRLRAGGGVAAARKAEIAH